MSRDLSSSADLPGSCDQVFALRTSQAWVDVKGERFGDGSALLERTEDTSGAVTTVVTRDLPDGAPGFLERFLPSDGKVVQRETWTPPDSEGISRGTWSVEIPGAPARLAGDSLLTPTDAGCRQLITGTAKVSVPLIGGKAEALVADLVTKLIEREARLMAEQLTR